jgi:hypothetical protein
MSREQFCARVALALSLAALTNQALAAPPAPVKEPGETAQYRGLLEEAVSEYDARRYEEARALFRRAHDISPNARTLRGIGMASFELREYVEAMRSLEGSLADKRRPLTATQRQQVESLLERTRAFVGRFFLKLSPKETTLRIDGAPMTLESDGSLLLSFGRHSVIAEASGSMPENREINVIGGERQELAFQLRAAADVPPPIKPLGPGGEIGAGGDGGPSTEASSTGAVWWYGAAGVAAGGAIGALFWWRLMDRRYNECASNRYDPVLNPRGCDNVETLSSSRRFAAGTTIAAASAALALAIVGTVTWVKKPEAGTAIACGLGPGAVNCELKFSF